MTKPRLLEYNSGQMENLLRKLETRDFVIGIVGLGYVGLPLALRFAEQKFKVVGFDIDKDKVERLERGQSYIEHIPGERIAQLVKSGFQATTSFARATECDALILCVPTPLNR